MNKQFYKTSTYQQWKSNPMNDKRLSYLYELKVAISGLIGFLTFISGYLLQFKYPFTGHVLELVGALITIIIPSLIAYNTIKYVKKYNIDEIINDYNDLYYNVIHKVFTTNYGPMTFNENLTTFQEYLMNCIFIKLQENKLAPTTNNIKDQINIIFKELERNNNNNEIISN